MAAYHIETGTKLTFFGVKKALFKLEEDLLVPIAWPKSSLFSHPNCLMRSI
jgi:hypothetical protein